MIITSTIKEARLVRNKGNHYGLNLILGGGIEITFGDWHYQIAEDWILPCMLAGDTITLSLAPVPPWGNYTITHLRAGMEPGKHWFDEKTDKISITGLQNIVNLFQIQLQETH